ncbi:TetR family transcriptional regulator [Streptomyces nigrescens]|uniref:TetR/AcrR family transcriptional regulator n=1 Tax=Streptomyces nigrescens TaxID=1920 RepID=UPI00347D8D37
MQRHGDACVGDLAYFGVGEHELGHGGHGRAGGDSIEGDAGRGPSVGDGRTAEPAGERWRQETRLGIAEAAAALVSGQGCEATTGEDIASAAGISLRTFYR